MRVGTPVPSGAVGTVPSMKLRVGGACTGSGGFELAARWATLGLPVEFEHKWMCEIDAARRKILKRHFKDVPIYEDLTKLDPFDLEEVDVLVGGTPCQDLSVAGRRVGLEGEKSRLFYDFMRIRHALNVPLTVWENVPGALSSNEGLDFSCVLEAFVGAGVAVPGDGWGSAGVVAGPWGGAVWRVMDTQHFGCPQRRRRLFVVGHLGGEVPVEVLLDAESRCGDLATGEAQAEGSPPAAAPGVGAARDLAPTLRANGSRDSSGKRGNRIDAHPLVLDAPPLAAPLTAGGHSDGVSVPGRRMEDDFNLVAEQPVLGLQLGQHGANGGNVCEEVSPALDTTGRQAVAFTPRFFTRKPGETGEGAGGAPPTVTKGNSEGFGAIAVAIPAMPEDSETSKALTTGQRYDLDTETFVAETASTLQGRYGKDRGAWIDVEGAAGGQLLSEYEAVRRLTPTECERLQGFPDSWTIPNGPSLLDCWPNYFLRGFRPWGIPGPGPLHIQEMTWAGAPLKFVPLREGEEDPLPDGVRYSAMGDAVSVPVVCWILRRLALWASGAACLDDWM